MLYHDTVHIVKILEKAHKNALAILFSGILLTAIVLITLLIQREKLAGQIHSNFFDRNGRCEVLVANSDDEIL